MSVALTECKAFDKRNQISDMTQVLPTNTHSPKNTRKICFSFDTNFSTFDLFDAWILHFRNLNITLEYHELYKLERKISVKFS